MVKIIYKTDGIVEYHIDMDNKKFEKLARGVKFGEGEFIGYYSEEYARQALKELKEGKSPEDVKKDLLNRRMIPEDPGGRLILIVNTLPIASLKITGAERTI